MFADSPFCESPFSSFEISDSSGEIFYFTGDIQELRAFVLGIAASESFVQSITRSDGYIVDIDQILSADLSIKREVMHTEVR